MKLNSKNKSGHAYPALLEPLQRMRAGVGREEKGILKSFGNWIQFGKPYPSPYFELSFLFCILHCHLRALKERAKRIFGKVYR